MFEISPLKTDDIAKVVEIEKVSFSAPKDEVIFRDDQNKYLVARENDEIVGYIGVENISGETHIINMAAKDRFRKKGIGIKLVEAVLNDRDVFFLEVRASNAPAQNLYEKFGFKKVGLRKKYYADNGEDACVMRREPL